MLVVKLLSRLKTKKDRPTDKIIELLLVRSRQEGTLQDLVACGRTGLFESGSQAVNVMGNNSIKNHQNFQVTSKYLLFKMVCWYFIKAFVAKSLVKGQRP